MSYKLPLPPLSMSLHLSWNSDWSDHSDHSSASCSGLCCQEEAKRFGEASEQLAQLSQHALHTFNALHAKPARLQVNSGK